MHEWVHDGHFTDEDIVYEGYDGPHITLGEGEQQQQQTVRSLQNRERERERERERA
jgi:hypothetical protein